MDKSRSRSQIYFANVAASHAQVFAKLAGRKADDFVRVGDMGHIEIELVNESCVEFSSFAISDVAVSYQHQSPPVSLGQCLASFDNHFAPVFGRLTSLARPLGL